MRAFDADAAAFMMLRALMLIMLPMLRCFAAAADAITPLFVFFSPLLLIHFLRFRH